MIYVRPLDIGHKDKMRKPKTTEYTPILNKVWGHLGHSHKPYVLRNVIGRSKTGAMILLQTLNPKRNIRACNIEVSKMQQL